MIGFREAVAMVGLARRPAQPAAADEVNVQMKDTLSGAGSDIQHRAITVLDAPFPGQFGRYHMTITYLGRVLVLGFLQSSNMPLGDDKDMSRRLRVYVLKCIGALVLIDFLRRNFALDDSAEKAVRLAFGHAIQFLDSAVQFQVSRRLEGRITGGNRNWNGRRGHGSEGNGASVQSDQENATLRSLGSLSQFFGALLVVIPHAHPDPPRACGAGEFQNLGRSITPG